MNPTLIPGKAKLLDISFGNVIKEGIDRGRGAGKGLSANIAGYNKHPRYLTPEMMDAGLGWIVRHHCDALSHTQER